MRNEGFSNGCQGPGELKPRSLGIGCNTETDGTRDQQDSAVTFPRGSKITFMRNTLQDIYVMTRFILLPSLPWHTLAWYSDCCYVGLLLKSIPLPKLARAHAPKQCSAGFAETSCRTRVTSLRLGADRDMCYLERLEAFSVFRSESRTSSNRA